MLVDFKNDPVFAKVVNSAFRLVNADTGLPVEPWWYADDEAGVYRCYKCREGCSNIYERDPVTKGPITVEHRAPIRFEPTNPENVELVERLLRHRTPGSR